ncbi:MAG: AGE family epimerase/isomerase, partial [Xanthomonadales bacterium]|nr:AGE family epimerase/isomerase [Xanthomonadales bacterium]
MRELDHALIQRWLQRAHERAGDLELGLYVGPFPEAELTAIAAVHESMNSAPREDLDVEDFHMTPAIMRQIEDSLTARGIERWVMYVRDPASGAYAWTIRDRQLLDATRHAYGMAFVLLAYAVALKAGIDEAAPWLEETWQLLEARFWDAEYGLYRDEADTSWVFSAYRGQNANMHLTEALLAAFEATAERRYLERALAVADAMTLRQAAQAGGLVWEHYDANWTIDWDYHRDDPKHLFRPWGFQPGHQTEWAKLLLILDRHAPRDWLLPTATRLFETAVERAWDDVHGGLCYGFAPDGAICDSDKYFWVQAESLAAAALLGERTGDLRHIDDYDKLWAYAWRHFVDHEHGAWYRILDRENRKYSAEKSPAGKTDYHTMGAC